MEESEGAESSTETNVTKNETAPDVPPEAPAEVKPPPAKEPTETPRVSVSAPRTSKDKSTVRRSTARNSMSPRPRADSVLDRVTSSLISAKKQQLLADSEESSTSLMKTVFSGVEAAAERSDKAKGGGQAVKHMNTYRLESKNPFHGESVHNVIRDIFTAEFQTMNYEAAAFSKLCVTLASEIRSKVKALGFERYKLVCIVQICEKNKQSVKSVGKFLWDPERDNCACYSFESTNFLASGVVFGLYFE